MPAIAYGVEALDVRGRTVVEVAEIRGRAGYLHAIQSVFAGGKSLTLAVWTDWRLVVELWSVAVIPDYLWPSQEMTRSLLRGPVGLVAEVTASHNEMGELVQAHFLIDGRDLVVSSYAGDLILDLLLPTTRPSKRDVER